MLPTPPENLEQQDRLQKPETQEALATKAMRQNKIERASFGDRIQEQQAAETDAIKAQIYRESMLSGKEITEMPEAEYQALMTAEINAFEKFKPELSLHLARVLPRLQKLTATMESLQAEDKKCEALHALQDFLDQEQKEIELIKDTEVRDILLAFIVESTNLKQFEKDLSALAWKDFGINVFKAWPGYGTLLSCIEVARGKTTTGKKLEGKDRLWATLEAGGSIVGDIMLFTPLALADAGVKVSIAGVTLGAKGLEAANALQKIAGIISKAKNFSKLATPAAKAVTRLSLITAKNPALAELIIKTAQRGAAKAGQRQPKNDILEYSKLN